MTAGKKTIVFVDGENLVVRYQEMAKQGLAPRPEVSHIEDCFVWSSGLLKYQPEIDTLRVNYYTHVVGGDEKVAEVSSAIASTLFQSRIQTRLLPRIHKKPAKSNKTKVVDIDITMDVMRIALTQPIDLIHLISGDGDFVPLVREVARSTTKQVHVSAFSSGLAEPLKTCAEHFQLLDEFFFYLPRPKT